MKLLRFFLFLPVLLLSALALVGYRKPTMHVKGYVIAEVQSEKEEAPVFKSIYLKATTSNSRIFDTDSVFIIPYHALKWIQMSRQARLNLGTKQLLLARLITGAVSDSPVYHDSTGRNKRVRVEGKVSLIPLKALPKNKREALMKKADLPPSATLAFFDQLSVCDPFSDYTALSHDLPDKPNPCSSVCDTANIEIIRSHDKKDYDAPDIRRTFRGYAVSIPIDYHSAVSIRKPGQQTYLKDTVFVTDPRYLESIITDIDYSSLENNVRYLKQLLSYSPLYVGERFYFESVAVKVGLRYFKINELKDDQQIYTFMDSCGIPSEVKDTLVKNNVVFAVITSVIDADPYHYLYEKEVWCQKFLRAVLRARGGL